MIDITKIDDWCIDRWREAWAFLSVKWAALGALILPLMQMVPVFPVEIQNLLPVYVRAPIAGLWCVVFIVLRLKAQKKLDAPAK